MVVPLRGECSGTLVPRAMFTRCHVHAHRTVFILTESASLHMSFLLENASVHGGSPAASSPLSGTGPDWAPWVVATTLIALCALQGVRMISGLAVPPDVDALR